MVKMEIRLDPVPITVILLRMAVLLERLGWVSRFLGRRRVVPEGVVRIRAAQQRERLVRTRLFHTRRHRVRQVVVGRMVVEEVRVERLQS
jgi:hypothetical protein